MSKPTQTDKSREAGPDSSFNFQEAKERHDARGRKVREVWIEWANEQPAPKPSWLVPYDELSEPDKDVDRRIGAALYSDGFLNGFNFGLESANEARRMAEERGLIPDGRCPSTSREARCWYFAGHPGELHRDMENDISWGRAFFDAPPSDGTDDARS